MHAQLRVNEKDQPTKVVRATLEAFESGSTSVVWQGRRGTPATMTKAGDMLLAVRPDLVRAFVERKRGLTTWGWAASETDPTVWWHPGKLADGTDVVRGD